MNALQRQWRNWAERIDAMSLRERAIVFFAAALVLIFLFNALLADPVTTRQRQVARDLSQTQTETRTLQTQVQVLLGQRGDDPDAARRAHLVELKQRIAETEAHLADKQRELVPPERIPALLEEMLRRERKLELVDLRSLPPAPLFDATKKPAKPQPGAGTDADAGAQPTLQVYRHGVEITVRGSYFDLLAWLGDLEKLPLRMYWHDIDLDAGAYPLITMKLGVYTLSLDRTWVVV